MDRLLQDITEWLARPQNGSQVAAHSCVRWLHAHRSPHPSNREKVGSRDGFDTNCRLDGMITGVLDDLAANCRVRVSQILESRVTASNPILHLTSPSTLFGVIEGACVLACLSAGRCVRRQGRILRKARRMRGGVLPRCVKESV